MHSTHDRQETSATTQWTADQVMFTLAYLAYDGETSTDPKVVLQELTADLAKVAPLQGQWQLVWGPTLFKFDISLLDDNMWYVARNSVTGEYVIAIRGTNFDAVLDWIVEDFWISFHKTWPYGSISGLDPKIADGTALAIDKLLSVAPAAGIPGAGLSLPQFLRMQAAAAPITVTVSGHSLGGCLSSTLALALKDTTTSWSPRHAPTVRSWSFAGPTAGNADFAVYTDRRLGGSLHRWVNTLDVAPLAWNETTLDDALWIYENHGLWPSLGEIALFGLAKTLALGGHYTQPSVGTVTRNGDFNITPAYQSYAAQADWQHTWGYAAILGLSNVLPRKASSTTRARVMARLEALQRRSPRTH